MLFPKIGQTAWINPISGSEVAPGWQKRQEVKVISERRDGLCYVTVEKPSGERIEVPHFQLDCGREYQSKTGEWLPESDPRVLRYIARMMQETGHENMMLARQHEDHLHDLAHVLQRNGWDRATGKS